MNSILPSARGHDAPIYVVGRMMYAYNQTYYPKPLVLMGHESPIPHALNHRTITQMIFKHP